MKDKELMKRVESLIKQGEDAIANSKRDDQVDRRDYIGFLGASVSFIGNVYSTNHS